jgi:chromosome segregation ATPase
MNDVETLQATLQQEIDEAKNKTEGLRRSIADNERAARSHAQAEKELRARIAELDARDASLRAREESVQEDRSKIVSERDSVLEERAALQHEQETFAEERKRQETKLASQREDLQKEKDRVGADLVRERREAKELDAASKKLERELQVRENHVASQEEQHAKAVAKFEKEKTAYRERIKAKLLSITKDI